jgi:hypothetical protein
LEIHLVGGGDVHNPGSFLHIETASAEHRAGPLKTATVSVPSQAAARDMGTEAEVRDLGFGRGGENSKGRVGRLYHTFIPN